jgi:hypothetical protein
MPLHVTLRPENPTIDTKSYWNVGIKLSKLKIDIIVQISFMLEAKVRTHKIEHLKKKIKTIKLLSKENSTHILHIGMVCLKKICCNKSILNYKYLHSYKSSQHLYIHSKYLFYPQIFFQIEI